jgi:hypothetical protein
MVPQDRLLLIVGRVEKETNMSQELKMPKIILSAEGNWTYDGETVTHERTVEDLFRRVYCEDGSYYLTGEKMPVPVIIEDVAFFVRDINQTPEGYRLNLSNGTTEILDPSTLDIGSANRLYCQVGPVRAKARFDRKVYNEFMKALTERDGYYGLAINGIFYPLRPVKEEVLTNSKAAPHEAEIAAKPMANYKSTGAVRHPTGPHVKPKATGKKTAAKSASKGKTTKKPKAKVKKIVKKSAKKTVKKTAKKVVRKAKPIKKSPAKKKPVAKKTVKPSKKAKKKSKSR